MPMQPSSDVRYYDYLELFFKQAEDAISVFDLDDKILTCNPAFEKLYGWTLNECVGKAIRFYPDTEANQVQKRCSLLYQGIALTNVQTLEKRKDGSLFQAEITMTPIFDENDKVVAVSQVTRDITSRLQLEQSKLDIERLQTIGMVAADVAHEVRNPMTAITGFIQMMNQDPANPFTSFTHIMEQEITRINQIVTDFLKLAGPTWKETKDFSIEDLLREVLDEYEYKFSKCFIRCSRNITNSGLMISGCRSSLKEALRNIVTNSIDAIGRNGHIAVSAAVYNNGLRIIIEDDGCGMSEQQLEMIYRPFFSTKDNGTGLGMIISKKIIIDHKGTLKVESLQSAWTKVTIHLPLSDKMLY